MEIIFDFYVGHCIVPQNQTLFTVQKTIGLYSLGLKCMILNFPLLDSPIIIDYCEKGPDLVTSNLTFIPFKGTVLMFPKKSEFIVKSLWDCYGL